MNFLRSRGLLSIIYLDDILCLGETKPVCQYNIQITYNFLKSLGFVINEKNQN